MKRLILASLMLFSTLANANNSGANFFYYGEIPDDKQISNKVTVLDVRPVFYNNTDKIRSRLKDRLKPQNNIIKLISSSKNIDEDIYVIELIKYNYRNVNIDYTNSNHMVTDSRVLVK